MSLSLSFCVKSRFAFIIVFLVALDNRSVGFALSRVERVGSSSKGGERSEVGVGGWKLPELAGQITSNFWTRCTITENLLPLFQEVSLEIVV